MLDKQYRYRVTIPDENKSSIVFRGVVPSKFEQETDGHIRSRIVVDLMTRMEFNWTAQDPNLI